MQAGSGVATLSAAIVTCGQWGALRHAFSAKYSCVVQALQGRKLKNLRNRLRILPCFMYICTGVKPRGGDAGELAAHVACLTPIFVDNTFFTDTIVSLCLTESEEYHLKTLPRSLG